MEFFIGIYEQNVYLFAFSFWSVRRTWHNLMVARSLRSECVLYRQIDMCEFGQSNYTRGADEKFSAANLGQTRRVQRGDEQVLEIPLRRETKMNCSQIFRSSKTDC